MVCLQCPWLFSLSWACITPVHLWVLCLFQKPGQAQHGCLFLFLDYWMNVKPTQSCNSQWGCISSPICRVPGWGWGQGRQQEPETLLQNWGLDGMREGGASLGLFIVMKLGLMSFYLLIFLCVYLLSGFILWDPERGGLKFYYSGFFQHFAQILSAVITDLHYVKIPVYIIGYVVSWPHDEVSN